MRLILVRHAETDHNRDGFAQGRADNPLNETGRAQCVAVAQALAHESVVAVRSSPLRRAMETAEAIAGRHGLAVEPEPDVIEMDVGVMDGLSTREMREQHAEFLRAWMGPGAATTPMPGGESLAQVQDRAWRTVERLMDEHASGVVVLVSHNFVIATLICRALDIDLADFRRIRQDVAACHALDLTPERTRVVRLNETCHLYGGRLPPMAAFWRRGVVDARQGDA